MKERPIIFSADSVKAIIDGRKTQTRRVVKPMLQDGASLAVVLSNGLAKFDYGNGLYVDDRLCPYGARYNTLWVREKWRIVEWDIGLSYQIEYTDGVILQEPGDSSEYDFDAYRRLLLQCGKDCNNAGLDVDSEGYYILKDDIVPTRWRSPIHMPRWASRITLEITDVRVERLQDINFRDLQAEAVGIQGELTKAMEEYIQIWDSLNSKRGYPWSNNPWVWVIEFQRVTP